MQKNRVEEMADTYGQQPDTAPIRYTASGAVDTEYYMRRARRLRAEALIEAMQNLGCWIARRLKLGIRRCSAGIRAKTPTVTHRCLEKSS